MMLSLFAALFLAVLTKSSPAIWPNPQSIVSGSEVVWLCDRVQIQLLCGSNTASHLETYEDDLSESAPRNLQQSWPWDDMVFGPLSDDSSVLSERLNIKKLISRAFQTIRKSQFVPWKFHARHAVFEPSLDTQMQSISSLRLYQSFCPATQVPFNPKSFFNADESYSISITNDTVEMKSNSTIGTIRALQTFTQLFYAHSSGAGPYLPHAPVFISDKPTWSHRGLSLDIARNAFGPRDVMRTIDALASTKMSRLHVHATDSQSWPLEIPCLPELATKGAYQSNLVWTTADLKHVQTYGIERGVQVFIELDMPGHTASIAHAYPDLIAAYDQLDWSSFAAEPLSGQLKLNSPAVYDFLDKLFSDLLPRVAQFSSLYHGGGDEVNRMVYLFDETVRSNETHVIRPFLQKFITFVTDRVRDAGMQAVLWEEMLLDWNLTLSKDTLIQVWRDSQHVSQVLERGHRVVFGDYSHWYLDCGYGQFTNPYPGGKSPEGIPFLTPGGTPTRMEDPYLDYCSPFKNWRHIYVYNPLANVSAELQHLLEGGEVLLWSEQTDPVDLDTKLWPRAAAAAEVLWSGPQTESMIENASKRLGEWRERLVIDYGIAASPVTMTWCLMQGGCTW